MTCKCSSLKLLWWELWEGICTGVQVQHVPSFERSVILLFILPSVFRSPYCRFYRLHEITIIWSIGNFGIWERSVHIYESTQKTRTRRNTGNLSSVLLPLFQELNFWSSVDGLAIHFPSLSICSILNTFLYIVICLCQYPSVCLSVCVCLSVSTSFSMPGMPDLQVRPGVGRSSTYPRAVFPLIVWLCILHSSFGACAWPLDLSRRFHQGYAALVRIN